MTTTALFAALGALFVSVVTGCGGNVTIDSGSGSGGSGGEGGGSGTTTGTTSTATNPETYCAGVCATAQQYGCLEDGLSPCVQSCTKIFAEFKECTSELTALYDCYVGQLPVDGCNGGADACQAASDAANECLNGGTMTCGTDGCSASSNNDCQCSGSCNGYTLEADCKGTSGAVECACLVDGQYVGSCKDMELTCDLYGGCCINYFPI